LQGRNGLESSYFEQARKGVSGFPGVEKLCPQFQHTGLGSEEFDTGLEFRLVVLNESECLIRLLRFNQCAELQGNRLRSVKYVELRAELVELFGGIRRPAFAEQALGDQQEGVLITLFFESRRRVILAKSGLREQAGEGFKMLPGFGRQVESEGASGPLEAEFPPDGGRDSGGCRKRGLQQGCRCVESVDLQESQRNGCAKRGDEGEEVLAVSKIAKPGSVGIRGFQPVGFPECGEELVVEFFRGVYGRSRGLDLCRRVLVRTTSF